MTYVIHEADKRHLDHHGRVRITVDSGDVVQGHQALAPQLRVGVLASGPPRRARPCGKTVRGPERAFRKERCKTGPTFGRRCRLGAQQHAGISSFCTTTTRPHGRSQRGQSRSTERAPATPPTGERRCRQPGKSAERARSVPVLARSWSAFAGAAGLPRR